MTQQVNEMDKVLGKKVEQTGEREIPGLTVRPSARVVYVSLEEGGDWDKTFEAITQYVDPPSATKGGASPGGCQIVTPAGQAFHALRYHGDLDGWSTDIAAGATHIGASLAMIDVDRLVIDPDTAFELAACEVTFY